MQIKKEFPPNYEEIKSAFKLSDKIMFCYGDAIYNPNDCYVDPIVIKHEEVHSKQQGKDPRTWWKRYLVDTAFRFCQELEAYQVQYREICKKFKDRNARVKMLSVLAQDLSSSNYGNVCSYQEAFMSIKGNIKFKV